MVHSKTYNNNIIPKTLHECICKCTWPIFNNYFQENDDNDNNDDNWSFDFAIFVFQ